MSKVYKGILSAEASSQVDIVCSTDVIHRKVYFYWTLKILGKVEVVLVKLIYTKTFH